MTALLLDPSLACPVPSEQETRLKNAFTFADGNLKLFCNLDIEQQATTSSIRDGATLNRISAYRTQGCPFLEGQACCRFC